MVAILKSTKTKKKLGKICHILLPGFIHKENAELDVAYIQNFKLFEPLVFWVRASTYTNIHKKINIYMHLHIRTTWPTLKNISVSKGQNFANTILFYMMQKKFFSINKSIYHLSEFQSPPQVIN